MKAGSITSSAHDTPDPIAETLRSALRGLKFGSVEITVHEGRIVQIERREKHRPHLSLDTPANHPTG
jgi:hypothetical protein